MIEFGSAADRDYYVNSDPAQRKFKELVGPSINVDVVRVFDFKPLLFKEEPSGSSANQGSRDCILC